MGELWGAMSGANIKLQIALQMVNVRIRQVYRWDDKASCYEAGGRDNSELHPTWMVPGSFCLFQMCRQPDWSQTTLKVFEAREIPASATWSRASPLNRRRRCARTANIQRKNQKIPRHKTHTQGKIIFNTCYIILYPNIDPSPSGSKPCRMPVAHSW